jgi:hypothetical protein
MLKKALHRRLFSFTLHEVIGFCEHGDEISVSIKAGLFFFWGGGEDQASNGLLFKRDTASWNEFCCVTEVHDVLEK